MVAITADKVVVELEAKLDRYNANVQRSERTFNRAMAGMTTSARRTEQSVIGSVRGIVGAYLGIQGARLAAELVDANTRIMNSLRVAGLEGEELTRVYNELFASAQKNAVPIESLAQLFGRVATVQKELGASTQEVIQFTDNVALALRVAGTNAQSASGAILQLSQAMGSGVVRAEEFNSILEGALPIAQAAAAGLEETGGSVAKLRKLVIEGKISSEAFFRAFEAGSVILRQKVANSTLTVAQGFTLLQNAFIDAAGRINEGTEAGRKFAEVLSKVAQAIRSTDFGPLIGEIVRFVEEIRQAAKDAVAFFEVMERKGSFADLGTDIKDAFKAIGFGRDNGDALGLDAGLDAAIKKQQANDRLRTALAESTRKGIEEGATTGVSRIDQSFEAVKPKTRSLTEFDAPDGDAKKKENAYAREIRHLQERKALMDAELGVLGQSQFMRDKALAAQELENARLQAKIPLNDTIIQQIEREAESYARMAEQVRNAEDRQQALNDLLQTFGDVAADTFIGLIDGTKSWNDALNDTLKLLAKMFAQAAFTGGGPLGTLLGLGGDNGGVGGLFGMFAKRAAGGSARQGQPHVVGEQGKELFVPGQSGRIIPNHRLSTAASPAPANGGIVMNNDFRGVVASERAYVDSRLAELERRMGMAPQVTSEVWKRQRPGLRVGA